MALVGVIEIAARVVTIGSEPGPVGISAAPFSTACCQYHPEEEREN
jgi:hypothetical protein